MKQRTRVSDAELDILRVIWENGEPMKASEIVKALADSRTWKTQTCHVLLGRLVQKGYLSVDKTNYSHKFSPIYSEEEYFAKQSISLASRVGTSLPSMIASLIESTEVTEKELAEVAALIRAKRRELGNKNK